ncbi:MAG: UTP--glucose-1-phosphate uridylyltransferase [bacterium]|nr:MAG: UTP--glucose-1-phosphate uridylyltransferase [bacterium]
MKPITKAVFPVGGFGTRFLPATKSVPKEMLTLIDKPLIHYGVEEAIKSGIDKMILITGRGKRAVADYFDHSYELESLLRFKGKENLIADSNRLSDRATYIYIRQKNPLGLGHAILRAEPVIEEPFAVVLTDDIIDSAIPVLKQMMDVYNETGGSVVAIMKVDKTDISKYGIIEAESQDGTIYKIKRLVEKPDPENAPSDLAVVGRYILSESIFEYLKQTNPDKGDEIQLTDAINLMAQNEPVYGFKFSGKRYDCGSKPGMLEATIDFALKDDALKDTVKRCINR